MTEFSFFYPLWAEPLVGVISSGSTLTTGLEIALGHAQGRPCHILVRPSWRLEDHIDGVVEARDWLATSFPEASLTVMTPGETELAMAQGRGLRAIHVHNSAIIDERLFTLAPHASKDFDAVHNAQAAGFKRHALAFGVPRLALITYVRPDFPDEAPDLIRSYRDLRYVNYDAVEGQQWLGPQDISGILNRSHCGLILSAVEGPCNAAMEYLLSGIPVVSTPSEGGRGALAETGWMSIVEATPAAIEGAVARFCAAPGDPAEIRRSALAWARPHRRRLIEWLSTAVDKDLMAGADENLWLPQFKDKLRQLWRIDTGPDGRVIATAQ